MIDQETLKERIDNIGITHKKISQLTGIHQTIISALITFDRNINQNYSDRLNPVLTAYEQALNTLL